MKLFVIFSGYNYSSASETLCWLTNLYLCWRHFNSLKPLPESQHLFSPGKRDSKLWTVLTLHFMLTPLAKIPKWCWKLEAQAKPQPFLLPEKCGYIYGLIWFHSFLLDGTKSTGGMKIAPATAVPLVWLLGLFSERQKMVVWTSLCRGCCFLTNCPDLLHVLCHQLLLKRNKWFKCCKDKGSLIPYKYEGRESHKS